MSDGVPDRPPDRSQILRHVPLVLASVVESAASVEQLGEELSARYPDVAFIGIITADQGDVVVPAIVDELAPHLGELIFTASSSPSAIAGFTLAETALNDLGVGQDFVFTVPELDDAVRYALDRLASDGDAWDGTAVLVLGSAHAIEQARRTFPAGSSSG